MWDVDGTGLQQIEDVGLAARLRAKVNAFNLRTTAIVGVAVIAFVLLPDFA